MKYQFMVLADTWEKNGNRLTELSRQGWEIVYEKPLKVTYTPQGATTVKEVVKTLIRLRKPVT